MKLDETFARELVKANKVTENDGQFLGFLVKTLECADALSAPHDTIEALREAWKTYDRAVIAACLATTIWERRNRLSNRFVIWANMVLALCTQLQKSPFRHTPIIRDNLHPWDIEKRSYAGELVSLTLLDE